MNNYHIDKEKWSRLTLFEQMGNIGSEVGRSIKAWQLNDRQRFESALSRAIDLFDATVAVMVEQKSGRVREVLIAKDQFLTLFFGDPLKGDEQKIEKYFMQYAIAARLHR